MSHRSKTPTTPLLSRTPSRSHVGTGAPDPIPGPLIRPLSRNSRRLIANMPIILSVFFAAFLIIQFSERLFDEPIPTGPPWHGPPFLLHANISRLLGPYSPYFPATPYEAPPGGCNITQVHILQRHGARFPTKGQAARIERALSHIKPPRRDKKNTSLAFMRKYRYGLRTDELLYFGAGEAWAAGVQAYNRYSHLAHASPPFLRVSDSSRIVETARNWREGFELAGRMRLQRPLILPEEAGMNNTLENNQCPNHSNAIACQAQTAYLELFAPPIVARLNAHAPGSTLDNEDIPALMSLCPFESLYKYRTSPWCDVFKSGSWDGEVGDGTGGEWEGYEYYMDLEKFYNTGPGNPLGRPQGIGYINELIARLTNSPVNDTTQTNRTLDEDQETFPLNRTMYADFTHDNEMTAILAAMGVLRETENIHLDHVFDLEQGTEDVEMELSNSPLRNQQRKSAPMWRKEMDPRDPNPHRKWIASKIVPFGARMIVEKLSCPSTNYQTLEDTIAVDVVRVLLNEAIIHVPGCEEALGNGICTLEEFMKSQSYSRNQGEGEWEACFEEESLAMKEQAG